MVSKSKVILTIILVAVFVHGASALDNVTVIESYPDGQPKHIIHTKPYLDDTNRALGKLILNPSWTCPPDEIPVPGETSIYSPEYLNNQRCKVMPKPEDYIVNEKVERWLNPYGQTISIQYLDRKESVRKLMPETVAETIVPSKLGMYYIDSEGYIVSYTAPQDVPSNRSVKPQINFQGGYTLEKAMQDLNLTREEAISEKNYDRIKAEAYNHSPEAMQKKIAELEGRQIPEIKATVAAMNETVARQGGLIENLLNWVKSTFGIDLH